MTLEELAVSAEDRPEAILIEDIIAGTARMNRAGRELLLPGCTTPTANCLLCRLHPGDAAMIMEANAKFLKTGRPYSAVVFWQSQPGQLEKVTFRKRRADGNPRLAISVFKILGYYPVDRIAFQFRGECHEE